MMTPQMNLLIFAITADRVGDESRVPNESLHFIGQSQVVDPNGNILVRAAETGEEGCVVEIDLEKRPELVTSQRRIPP